MILSKTVRLPDDEGERQRFFEYGYVGHGDLSLVYWEGSEANDEVRSAPFQFSHSSELVLLGCMIGFYRRLGRSEEVIRELFYAAADGVLSDPYLISREDDRLSHATDHVQSFLSGERYGRFNQDILGWDALTTPIPAQPGVIDLVGGTGVYSRSDIFGRQSFLLAQQQSNQQVSRKKTVYSYELPVHVDFYERDIPVLAKTICDLSMGDYRKEIFDFMHTDLTGRSDREL